MLGLIGYHVGARWYFLSKILTSPEKQQRLSIVPTELELGILHTSTKKKCNIGYATFAIPNTSTMDLKSSSEGTCILGKSESLSLAIMKPYNPKLLQAENVLLLDKLSKSDPMRALFADGDILNIKIQTEKVIPVPFLDTLLMDNYEFKLYTSQLLLKALTPDGKNAVYTFSTPRIKGLIYVGEKSEDLRYANVSLQSQIGTQAVDMICIIPDGHDGNIMKILPLLLKTFQFTVEGLDSEAEVNKIVLKAGITPELEEDIK